MTAVTLFSIAARTRRTLHDLASDLSIYPQVLVNVRVTDKSIAEHPAVRDAIAAAERDLANDGRINVRPSGTEPLVRVMVESSDASRTHAVAETVANAIRKIVASHEPSLPAAT
jgi:phosphoglucosamine mutase